MEPIKKRIADLQEWLSDNHPEVSTEQLHLDAGTPERAFGYLVALKDVLRFLGGDQKAFD